MIVAVVVKPKLPVNDGVGGGGATQWGAAAVVVKAASRGSKRGEREGARRDRVHPGLC